MAVEGSWARRELGFVFWPRNEAGRAIIATLEREGDADRQDDGHFVDDARVAGLSPWELEALGLPKPGPFRLEVRGDGPITSRAFKLKSRLLRHDGKPVMGAQRDGVLFRAASQEYVLLDPLYTLLEAAQAYAQIGPNDMDERFTQWDRIKNLLPEDAVVDQQLQTIHLVRADSFTLDVREDASFDPVLISRSRTGPDGAMNEPALEEALPSAHQETFSDRFRQMSDAAGHYALGGGWYVVVPDETRRALSVVQKKQRESAASRRAFIANPHATLREALDGDNVEELFIEQPQFLSGRVQCLGEWHPKLCAYVSDKGNNWLPEEAEGFTATQAVGVLLGDHFVSLPLGDVPSLYAQVREAQQEGRETVNYQGISVPADDSTLKILDRLVIREPGAQQPGSADEYNGSEESESDPELVPIVIDNLDELGYAAKQPRRSGQPGGIPAALATRHLYPHQSEGVRWLQTAWIEGMPGVLLADDMGLGKTLQTLTFLAWLQERFDAGEHPSRPFLIVAPTGLLRNWESEARTHLVEPGLGTLLRAYGKELSNLEQEGLHRRTQRLQDADWVMTTYETLRDRIQTFLPVEWAVVGFDEAQKIKNPGARVTEMAKSLESDFVITVTGTPVENSLSDLWSLMDATHAGLLGSLKEFRDNYQKPAEEEGNPGPAQALRQLLEDDVSPPAILRRLKDDHLDGLPTKSAHELREEMPDHQAQAYMVALHKGLEGKGTPGAVLEAIQRLRKTSLLSDAIDETGITDAVIDNSARLRGMVKALDGIHARGEKALVFVEYLDLQEALIPYLMQRYGLRETPLRISGRVGGPERKRAVDAFQNRSGTQFDVMLLSPKAGGVGLTLTAANHVIHLTRWWNPAVEDQCTDRVYRIGQERDVHIYYPMALHPVLEESSFDLTLHRLLERKRDLSRQVLAAPVAGEDELAGLWREASSERTRVAKRSH